MRDEEAARVQGCRTEEIAIDQAPPSARAEKQNPKADHDNEILDKVAFEIPQAEEGRIGRDHAPGHGREDIYVEPKNREKKKIDRAVTQCFAHFSRVRRKSEGGHHGHGMQKED